MRSITGQKQRTLLPQCLNLPPKKPPVPLSRVTPEEGASRLRGDPSPTKVSAPRSDVVGAATTQAREEQEEADRLEAERREQAEAERAREAEEERAAADAAYEIAAAAEAERIAAEVNANRRWTR